MARLLRTQVMPLRKIIAERHIDDEVARVMHAAYDAVQAYISKNNVKNITGATVARKILDAVVAGEREAKKIANDIIASLKS
jgi:hypothetical protein